MPFFIDKIVDGLFIFVGVYFAFWFDQYQQDLTSKRELDFNITQIMRDLPEKEAPVKVPRFRIKQVQKEANLAQKDPRCDWPIKVDFQSAGLGDEYLRIIKQRGLVRFLEDEQIIRYLTYYYGELIPKYKSAMNIFYENYQDLVVEQSTKNEDRCLSQPQLDKLANRLRPLYLNARIADGFATNVGYQILQRLKLLGYTKPPRQVEHFQHKLEEYDEETPSPTQ